MACGGARLQAHTLTSLLHTQAQPLSHAPARANTPSQEDDIFALLGLAQNRILRLLARREALSTAHAATEAVNTARQEELLRDLTAVQSAYQARVQGGCDGWPVGARLISGRAARIWPTRGSLLVSASSSLTWLAAHGAKAGGCRLRKALRCGLLRAATLEATGHAEPNTAPRSITGR